MGFNSVFKGLTNSTYCQASCKTGFQKDYPSKLWYQVYM